jgi:DNA repair exonuclease SbcCD ATPase subunit
VSSAWVSATIEGFEQVSLENGTELFRVHARGRVGDDPEPSPALVCRAPDDDRTYEPLSAGGDRRGLLRLAYAIPATLLDASATFALQLPDGDRIDLPRPAPGASRADVAEGRRAGDVPRRPSEPAAEPAPAELEGASRRIGELEHEREQLQRRLAEVTAAHAAVRTERDEALRGAGASQAQRDEAHREAASVRAQRDAALAEAEAARAQRDEALREADAARTQREAAMETSAAAAEAARAARAELDSVLDTTAVARAEHARLTRRLRQQDARFELLRADAHRTEPGFGAAGSARLRRLEAEREQLVGHVRALAELVAANARTAGSDRYAPINGATERIAATREHAVRAAHEQAERDLVRMLADPAR